MLVIAFFLISMFIPQIYAEEIAVVMGEWPPYTSRNLTHHGVTGRIISESFALSGIKVKFQFPPWNKAYVSAETGNRDVAGVWFHSQERQKEFYYSDAIGESSHYFFHLKGSSLNWNNVDGLQEIRVGRKTNTVEVDEFLAGKTTKILKVHHVDSDRQAFQLMYLKQIDIYPQDILVSYFVLQQLYTPEQIQSFTYHPKPFKQISIHLLFLKELNSSQRLLKTFNKGLQDLKKSGKYQQYVEELRQGKYLSKRENKSVHGVGGLQ